MQKGAKHEARRGPQLASGLGLRNEIRFRYTGLPYELGAAGAHGDYPEVRYELTRIAAAVDRDRLAEGPSSLWRYAPVLPVADPEQAVTLGEGWTPLLPLARLGTAVGLPRLYAKDEGRNPSGTFKDRGASVAVSRLRELGLQTFIHKSSGNSGAAWALYSARAGVNCIDVLASDALPAALQQASCAGANIFMLDDDWRRAGSLVADAAARNGWVNVGGLKEPYRLEGKKTMGYEICEQLGWRMPDVLVYPTGGGLGAIAIYKAFAELIELGWITPAPLPRLIVAQYAGCAPIVRAFEAGEARVRPWDKLDVPPGGLKSPYPPGDRGVLDILRQTNGMVFGIETQAAVANMQRLARLEGVFTCPESATTLAALETALRRGAVTADETVVVLLTGSGLKSVPVLPAPDVRRLGPGDHIPHLCDDSTQRTSG